MLSESWVRQVERHVTSHKPASTRVLPPIFVQRQFQIYGHILMGGLPSPLLRKNAWQVAQFPCLLGREMCKQRLVHIVAGGVDLKTSELLIFWESLLHRGSKSSYRINFPNFLGAEATFQQNIFVTGILVKWQESRLVDCLVAFYLFQLMKLKSSNFTILATSLDSLTSIGQQPF